MNQSELSAFDPLEDLFTDAMLNRKIKAKRPDDPSMRNALDATAKRMKELYTLPENWVRNRGLALIDRDTQTLVGNFSEYLHKSIAHTRKLLREHQPIPIDGVEVVTGYLGETLEFRLRGNTWEASHACKSDLWMDELMVGAPAVELEVKTRLGAVARIELAGVTQFASANGAIILTLPAGTNVLEQLSQDSKAAVRKELTCS